MRRTLLLILLVLMTSSVWAAKPGGSSDHNNLSAEHTVIQQKIDDQTLQLEADLNNHNNTATTERQNNLATTLLELDNVQANTDAKTQTIIDLINEKLPNPPPGASACTGVSGGPRFVVSPDDTEVCDEKTGLTWTKDLDGSRGNVSVNYIMRYTDAIQYCDQRGAVLGNGNTYRLPTMNEFAAVMDFSTKNPSLPIGHPFLRAAAPPEEIYQSPSLWSSTPANNNPPRTPTYYLANVGAYGVVIEIPVDNAVGGGFHAWCVR